MIRWWRWFGITFPLLDFGLGAAAGALMDLYQPPTHYYPVSTWVGFGATAVFFGFLGRLLHSASERDIPPPHCDHMDVYLTDGLCMDCREYVGRGLAEFRAATNDPPLWRFSQEHHDGV